MCPVPSRLPKPGPHLAHAFKAVFVFIISAKGFEGAFPAGTPSGAGETREQTRWTCSSQPLGAVPVTQSLDSPAFQSAPGRECPEPGTGGAGVGAGGSRATDADTPVCDFTGAGAGQSGGRGARRGERLGAHLVGGAVGSARPGGGDGPLRCLGDGTERDRSGPRGSGPCGRCHSQERGRHRSPLTGIAAGVGGHAVN